MAHSILWIDGFDELGGVTNKYSASERNFSFEVNNTQGTPFNYGKYLRMTTLGVSDSDHWIGPDLPGAPFTALFTSFWLLPYGAYDLNGNFFFEFWDESVPNKQCDIRLFADPVTGGHRLVLRRGVSDIYVWSAPRMHFKKWVQVSIKFVVSPVVGIVELAVDGESLGSFSGNTQNTVNTRVDRLRIRTQTGNYADRVLIDDWTIATGLATDPLLPVSRVLGANMPNANVAVQWTPSGAASNWQTVDEIPPNGNTDYNSASTSGYRDAFSHAAVTNNLIQIHGVRVNANALQDAGDQIQNLVRVGGTDYYGATKTPTSSYFSYGHIWQDNPATSAPWTPSDAINAGFGYRRV